MEPRLQRRIQRYGWDRAADDYEPLWQAQLARAHARMLACAALAPGAAVLDVACGTGLVTFAAARAIGPCGQAVGVDISEHMVDAARRSAEQRAVSNATFARMDAERLDLPDACVDVVLCAFGLMFLPEPEQAVREMRRVLRPGGRIVLAVWGERSLCRWSGLFSIVDAEVASEVCPLFFRMGRADTLARVCAEAGFGAIDEHRLLSTLDYASAAEACGAAFTGGPVALAWSRFDDATRARVRARYLESIARWRSGDGYRVPSEFVVVAARN